MEEVLADIRPPEPMDLCLKTQTGLFCYDGIMTRLLIIGTQLAGKTTLVNYFRKHTNIAVTEIDEEILKRSDNTWPKDLQYKEDVLVPEIINELILKENIILFASYLSKPLIYKLKENKYKIVILEVSRDEIARRNSVRTSIEKNDDTSRWMVGEIELQGYLEQNGLVDGYIDAEAPTETIAEKILKFQLPSHTEP